MILDIVMNFLYLLCQPDADNFRNERTSLREWTAGSDSSCRLKLLHFLLSKMENIKHESKKSPPSFYSDFISGIISLPLIHSDSLRLMLYTLMEITTDESVEMFKTQLNGP